MRIIVNNKALYAALEKLTDKNGLRIIRCDLIKQANKTAKLFGLVNQEHKYEFVICESSHDDCFVEGLTGRRWDWVMDICNQTSEQPIVFEVHPNVLNVIFQY